MARPSSRQSPLTEDVEARHHGRVGERQAPRPDDECMGRARSWIVRACLDILPLVDGERVLLGRRTHEPRKDEWWLFGGKWPWGTDPRSALVEVTTRELGLQVEAARFVELPYRSLCWEQRREPPTDDGCHDLNHPFSLSLSAAEASAVVAHLEAGRNPEMSAVRAWSVGELEAEYGPDDPAVAIAADAFRLATARP